MEKENKDYQHNFVAEDDRLAELSLEGKFDD